MKDLTQGSITRQILTMAIPIAIGMITQMAYQLVDLYFVTRLGVDATAGVNTAGNVNWLKTWYCIFLLLLRGNLLCQGTLQYPVTYLLKSRRLGWLRATTPFCTVPPPNGDFLPRCSGGGLGKVGVDTTPEVFGRFSATWCRGIGRLRSRGSAEFLRVTAG